MAEIMDFQSHIEAKQKQQAEFQWDVQAACFDMIGFSLQHIFDHVKLLPMNDLTLHEAQTLLDLAFQEAQYTGKVWRANHEHLSKWNVKITGFTARFENGINQLTIDPVVASA